MRRFLGVGSALVLAMSAAQAMAKEVSIGYVDGWADSVGATNMAAAQMNFKDAKIGLIVPEYVKATSIADLKTDTSFKQKIVGIDAGSGVMIKTDQAIKDYDLTGYKLQASSGAAMTAELGRAYAKQQSIAVTGWVPHWMFAKWKLKFLEDPKGVYGAAETVNSIGSKELATKAPEVAEFLKKFSWQSKDEIGEVMLAIQEGAKPEAAAKDWVAKHPDRVKEWTGK